MLESLAARAADAVEIGQKAGADDVWATASQVRGVELTHRDGELEKVAESTSRSLRVRLYVDGRYSTHATTDLRPEMLVRFLEDAVALTRALHPDEHRQLPPPELFEGRTDVDLELVDPAILGLSREQRLAWCQQMNARASEHERVISATAYTFDNHGWKAVASSNGFAGTWEGASLWLGTEVTIRDEGDVRPEGHMWVGGRQKSALPDPDEVAREGLAQALVRLGSRKGPTVQTTMVVDPRAAGRLVGSLLAPARASALQQQRSFWQGRLGEPIASPALTIVDDPLLTRGIASRWFDSEGIAARRMPIIEGGVAKNIYVDTYYGKKTGMKPTTGSSSNLVVAPGEHDLEALLSQVQDGVYVASWLGGNSDATTGDFSFGMRGRLIEGGKLGAPIGEMNVTGNLMDLFSSLVAVGSDPWRYSSMRVPTLVFEGVQFSGA